jgi:hypothetical protein
LKKLRDENARLTLEVGTLISENQAARKQAGAALAAAERIWMFAHQAGEVVAKAELFDEKVGIGSKPSGTRIALILTDYSEMLERVLEDMREVVNHVTSLRRQPERQDLATSSSKGVSNLSKLSTLYSFSWDYSGSLGLFEAIIFHILGVFIDSMNMGGLWYFVPYVHVTIY